MHSFQVVRIAAIAGALALVSACSTTQGSGSAPQDASAPPLATLAGVGRVHDYCPRVTLREGTAILRKGLGEEMQYIASIADTSRECTVEGGQMRIRVGIAGRVVPGPAAKAATISLPVRVAVLRGTELLYSRQGTQTLSLEPGAGGVSFVYVDADVAFPEPTAKDVVIFAGFDEGPAKK